MNVVLDTNVLVSALKTQGGNCALILDLAIEGGLTLCMDQRIMAEHERVCRDPRLKLDAEMVRTVLDFVRDTAERVVPLPRAVELPDADDRPFVEVAGQANAVLVTGNKKHFPARACRAVRAFTPAEFLEELRRRPPA
jgi:putative PIN family toxin of toxin-antitoxin system